MKLVGKIVKNPLFWIFLLALILRIFRLGTFPYGFHVDEVKVGWNALSILNTGADDHGNIFSLYYNSIGDYRPTGIFYFSLPFIAILGKSIFAVRLSSALFGALSIFPIYFLARALLKDKKIGYVTSLLLAISPWHIETSRATSEVVISTFFAISAVYFLIRLIKTGINKYVYLTIISILLSYFLYHAIRFLAPLLFLTIIAFYYKEIRKKSLKKLIFICLAATFILSLFLSTTKEGRQRFDQVSIFKDIDINYEIERIRSENKDRNIITILFDNKDVIYLRRLITEYGAYFSGDFLIGDSAKPYRYTTPGVGLLTFAEAALLILGLVQIIKGKGNLLPLLILLIAPLPAAITSEDVPNLHRAFLMLPSILLIEGYGFERIINFSRKRRAIITRVILFLLTLNSIYFLHMYLHHSQLHKPYIKNYVLDGSSYRNLGAVELAKNLESEKGNYEKIIVTNSPDNQYPWYAFFNGLNPKEFNKNIAQGQKGIVEYGNITFSNLKCPSDDSFINYHDENILVIDSPECAYESKIRDGLPIKVVNEIERPDGGKVYVFLAKTGPIPDKFLKK